MLRFATSGVNIIPTVLLGLMLFYWIFAIIGMFDFELIDFDMEGADGGPFDALAIFLNVGEVPFALVLSLIIINNWIIAMMMYFAPIESGGLISGLLLIPIFIASVLITKFQIIPIRYMIENSKRPNGISDRVLEKACTLLSDANENKLGQADIPRNGASIVVNVLPENAHESFTKGEHAVVIRKDEEKNIYYIAKQLNN